MNVLLRFQKRCALTMLSGLLATAGAVAQSGSFGSTHVASGGEMAIHGAQTFTSSGMITTNRSATPGVVSFMPTATHTGASDGGHVDGYVRQYGSGVSTFMMPIGQGGKLRTATISGTSSQTTTAAYFVGNPGSSTLAAGGFPTTSKAANVSTVSTAEYWDINGAQAVNISLTWDAASGVQALTNGDLANLRIVGWNTAQSRWEVVPSGGATGTASGTGTVSTSAAIVPNTYNVYTLAFAAPTFLSLNATVLLSGPIDGAGTGMLDGLRNLNLIPSSQPYTGANFLYAGTETVAPAVLATTGTTAIVDWVLVQLRTGSPTSTTVAATRAALLRRDGKVVDLDGVSSLTFAATAGSYYVAVRHRNHLGVRSGSAPAFSFATVNVDFTDPNTTNGGTHAQRVMPSGRRALWSGNANSAINRNVLLQGNANDPAEIASVVQGPTAPFAALNVGRLIYSASDTNMDGAVLFRGSNNDVGPVSASVFGFPLNQPGQSNLYGVGEQIQ